jgi:hypothetical protein
MLHFFGVLELSSQGHEYFIASRHILLRGCMKMHYWLQSLLFSLSTVPMYQSELCNPRNRGILLSLQGTVTTVGLYIAYLLNFGLSFAQWPIKWRLPISFQVFFAIYLVLQMPPLPEIPRYVIEKGRNAEATDMSRA